MARLCEESMRKAPKNSNSDAEYFMVFDEFTSVLDRQTAMCMSASFSKFIRREKAQRRLMAPFILATTNTDIIHWLQPSLVISLGSESNNKYGMKFIENPHFHSQKHAKINHFSLKNPPIFRKSTIS